MCQLLLAGDFRVYSPNIFQIREIWQPKTVTIFLCHSRPVISIAGKYLNISMISAILLLSASEFLITILNFCYRSIPLKQMLFSHSARNIFLLRIFVLFDQGKCLIAFLYILEYPNNDFWKHEQPCQILILLHKYNSTFIVKSFYYVIWTEVG